MLFTVALHGSFLEALHDCNHMEVLWELKEML